MPTAVAAPPPRAAPAGAGPALADGIELIGEFEESGFRHAPYLARRRDGQVIQLSKLLYLTAEVCDGRRDPDAIAEVVSRSYGRRVSADNVEYLVEEKLRPLGVLALADGSTPSLRKRAPLFALRHRRRMLSESRVNAVAAHLTWLHRPSITAVTLAAVALLDVWLLGFHGVAGGFRSAFYNPELLLAVVGSVVLATAFHEFGHASACRRGGARPGEMGVGVYLVWPAFYCDVTDSYRLGRRARLRTDLGGVYFNAIVVLLCGVVYFFTGEEAALLAALLQHTIILQQLLPLLRFDGYYVLSDLTGVPDILSRIKPIFRSFVRGARREPRVAELRPWVRFVVSAYLLALIPALGLLIAWLVMAFPRLAATVYDALGLQLDRFRDAAGAGELFMGGFQIAALALPVAAISLSLGRTGRMAGRGLVRWSRKSRVRQLGTIVAVVAVAGAVVHTLLPNGDYVPVRPGERWNVPDAIRSVGAIPSGRPSFTAEQETRFAPGSQSPSSEPAGRGAPAREPSGRSFWDEPGRNEPGGAPRQDGPSSGGGVPADPGAGGQAPTWEGDGVPGDGGAEPVPDPGGGDEPPTWEGEEMPDGGGYEPVPDPGAGEEAPTYEGDSGATDGTGGLEAVPHSAPGDVTTGPSTTPEVSP